MHQPNPGARPLSPIGRSHGATHKVIRQSVGDSPMPHLRCHDLVQAVRSTSPNITVRTYRERENYRACQFVRGNGARMPLVPKYSIVTRSEIHNAEAVSSNGCNSLGSRSRDRRKFARFECVQTRRLGSNPDIALLIHKNGKHRLSAKSVVLTHSETRSRPEA